MRTWKISSTNPRGHAEKKAGAIYLQRGRQRCWRRLAKSRAESGTPETAVRAALAVVQEFIRRAWRARPEGVPADPAARAARGGIPGGAPGRGSIWKSWQPTPRANWRMREAGRGGGPPPRSRRSRLGSQAGLKFSAPPAVYGTPEVDIRKSAEGSYVVEPVRDALACGCASARKTRRCWKNPETARRSEEISRRKDRAGQFELDSLHQRRTTIRRIAEEIAAAQASSSSTASRS
jgi:hypothetical protein